MRGILLYLSSFLSQYLGYWQLNYFTKSLTFYIKKRIFQFRRASTEATSDISVLKAITSVSVRSVLFSVLIGFAFILVSSVLRDNPLSTLHSSLEVLDFLTASTSEQQVGAFDGLLIAVITVTGIFLTLYLTNLNTLAGTLYARLPNELRDLVVEDRVGNVYIRFLINLTLLSLLFLSYGVAIGYRPILFVVVISALGLLAIPVFAQLSARSFRLFDPTLLIMVLLRKLNQWSDLATVKGSFWKDNSFQNHYRQQAAQVLSAISSLADIAHEENLLKKEPLSYLLRNLNYFLSQYIPKKRIIPSDSYWFIRKPKYQSWFLSGSATVGLATHTQTDVQPELEPDRNWIEEEILRLDIDSIERTLKDGRTTVAITILDALTSTFTVFGKEWDISYPGRELHTIFKITKGFLDRYPHSSSQLLEQPEQFKENLALVDYLGLLPLELLLGFCKQIEEIDLEKLMRSVETNNWADEKEIYKLDLSSSTLATLEDIQRRINFEKLIEDKTVSAKWYIRQLVFQNLAVNVQKQLDELLNSCINLYSSALNWKSKDFVLYGVTLASRGGEFRNKFLVHLNTIKQFASKLDEERTESSIPWPTWDWGGWVGKVENLFDELSVFYAECISDLAGYSEIQGFPDYFGRAVHMIGEECFRALVDNDAEKISRILRHYFGGVFIEWDVLGRKTGEWEKENALLANSQPVLDLCELSGYCYFFAEYHQNPELWNRCKRIWDNFFKPEIREERIKWIDALLSFNSYYNFLLTDRGLLRSQWDMTIAQILNRIQRKYVPTAYTVYYPIHIADHPSELIKVMAGHEPFFINLYDGIDIFVDLYLKSFSEAEDLNFGRHSMLADAIRRYKEREADEIEDPVE